MAEIDRATAHALVEAGYMSLKEYIERFGSAAAGEPAHVEPAHVESPSTAPDACESPEPVPRAAAATAPEGRQALERDSAATFSRAPPKA
jgi:hypothetical protein